MTSLPHVATLLIYLFINVIYSFIVLNDLVIFSFGFN